MKRFGRGDTSHLRAHVHGVHLKLTDIAIPKEKVKRVPNERGKWAKGRKVQKLDPHG